MRVFVIVLVVACACLFGTAGVATAGWPFPAHSAMPLGFGDQYLAPDGRTCTHRGIDISCAPGESALAPLEGSVSFAGRVPGPHGGTVLAVTIDTGELRVSMLPLDRLDVAAGDRLRVGSRVGSVAASGDPSSAGTHLHVGVRRADLYIDPMSVFAVPPVPVPEAPAEVGEPVPAGAKTQAPAPAPPAAVTAGSAAMATQTARSATAATRGQQQPVTAADPVAETVVSWAPVSVAADVPAALGEYETARAGAPLPGQALTGSRALEAPTRAGATATSSDKAALPASSSAPAGRLARAWLLLLFCGAGVGALVPAIRSGRAETGIDTGSRGEVVAAAASR